MKASELRIGVNVLHNGKVTHVYQIEHRFKEIYRINDISFDERVITDVFNPIALTEEWLLKFGFKRSEAEDVVYYQHGKLVVCNWDNKGFIMSNAFSFDLRVNLDTVHQLQNLYFALTGIELKLNEK